MDTAFRKIDVDIYDEDVLLPDSELYEADPRGSAEVLEDAKTETNHSPEFSKQGTYVWFCSLCRTILDDVVKLTKKKKEKKSFSPSNKPSSRS